MSTVPPSPPENPVSELKRHHTVEELRSELYRLELDDRGSKTDLALRLVKHKSGILTMQDVFGNFTVPQLKRRVTSEGNKTKTELCQMMIDNFDAPCGAQTNI